MDDHAATDSAEAEPPARKQLSRKRSRGLDSEAAQEKALTDELFGADEEAPAAAGDDDDGGSSDDDGFVEDAASAAAAWADSDDEELEVDLGERGVAGASRRRKLRTSEAETAIGGSEYSQRLRERYAETVGAAGAAWATAGGGASGDAPAGAASSAAAASDDNDDSDSDDDASEAIPGGRLDVRRCKDANVQAPTKAVVRAVDFHPSGTVLLTGGFDKTLRFFEVDGERNRKTASVFLPDMPVHHAQFVGPEGRQVIAAGRRPFFYWFDVASGALGKVPPIVGRKEKSLERFSASPDGKWLAFTGNDGYVVVLDAKSKQWAFNVKINGNVRRAAWSADSQRLMAAGTQAEVYTWDVRSRKCVSRYYNEGGGVATALCGGLGSASGLLAVGSDAGVVNLYDHDAAVKRDLANAAYSARPVAPIKSVLNLTTPIDLCEFSPDGNLLAMGSSLEMDAFRLVHVPSRTVFSNWPTANTPIHYASSAAFSPRGGYLAVGNDRGRVLLYRLMGYARA